MFESSNLNEILKRYREERLAHAYLVETNNIEKALADLKILIKNINCNQEYSENCKDCNLCNLIDKSNLPSLKIIEPDGLNIKKNQIEELKEEFSKIPIYSKYNVYIIKNADKLNPSSANSMLKFIEEPENGIIGFFLTNNKDVMMDTIKSRCEIIYLEYIEKELYKKLGLNQEEYEKYLKTAIEYIIKLNSQQIINHKKEILSIYKERQEIEIIFKIIFNIYYENFLKIIKKEFDEEIISKCQIDATEEKIIEYLKIITEILHNLSYNVSIELLLDKFIIEMRGQNG